MKTALKIIAFFVAGFAIGLVVAVVLLMVFSDKGLPDVTNILNGADVLKALAIFLSAILALGVALLLQVIVHEGGHLVAGLLTGYRLVSFRILNWALIRRDGKWQWHRFSVSGTGGQCLMKPPHKPLSQINTRWYNLGGVLANLVVATIALVLYFGSGAPTWCKLLLMMTALVGYGMALLNGIPLRLSGINNDGYNMLFLERSPRDKRLLCQLLEANAMIQEGTLPNELPEEMFSDNAPIDWSDGIQANWQLMVIARLEMQHRWEEAYQLINQALAEQRIMPLIATELTLEKIFICLMLGRCQEAQSLRTDKLSRYVQQFERTQSSKQRIRFAVTLMLDGHHDQALAILTALKTQRSHYLMQGEVAMDIALMQHLYDTLSPEAHTPIATPAT